MDELPDPDIFIYIEDDTVDSTFINLETMYNLSEQIYNVCYILDGNEYVFKKINEIRKMIEEAIHACLPYPNSRLLGMNDEDDVFWKYYLLQLLKEDNDDG